MIETKTVILWSLLVLLAIGTAEEIWTNEYETNIEHGVLKSVKQLQRTEVLNLSNRGIKDIDKGVFKNVNFKILNLESNDIFHLKSGIFLGLGENLEKLNLGSNQINIIDSSFVGLRNMKLLNFSNNPVEYLAAGEFAGIPHAADILIQGNHLHTLSARIFEERRTDPSNKESSATKVRKNDPDRLVDSLVSLAEKAQTSLMAVAISDNDKPRVDLEAPTIVCIKDSILTKVSILPEDEHLPENCVYTASDSGILSLELQSREIKDVTKEWYQLRQFPITVIDFSSNNLTKLSPKLLNDLPRSVQVVDLSQNLINKIKKDSFSNKHLKVVSLKANLIENVEVGSFESSNLWALDCSDNKISDILFSASLPASLNMLLLKKNRIRHIPNEVFSGLKNLMQLDLGQNGITTIQSNAFTGLTSLKVIDLGRNKISKIEAGAFLDPKNLNTISLNSNFISSFEDGIFDSLVNLTNLQLTLNKFTTITKNNFARLPASLLILNLEENEITDIDDDFFVDVPKQTLKLTNNKLSKIRRNQFKINSLVELNLGNNSITEISRDAFVRLPAVKYLSLARNKISEILPGTTRYLTNMTLLDISRNEIVKLYNGALHGMGKADNGEIFVDGNKLECIQGGIFEDV